MTLATQLKGFSFGIITNIFTVLENRGIHSFDTVLEGSATKRPDATGEDWRDSPTWIDTAARTVTAAFRDHFRRVLIWKVRGGRRKFWVANKDRPRDPTTTLTGRIKGTPSTIQRVSSEISTETVGFESLKRLNDCKGDVRKIDINLTRIDLSSLYRPGRIELGIFYFNVKYNIFFSLLYLLLPPSSTAKTE